MKTFKYATAFACFALFAAQAVSAGSLPLSSSPAAPSLTKENLADFLRSVGHDPSSHDNEVWITVPLLGRTQTIAVGLSKDSTRLWVYAKITSFTSLAGVPADTFSRLLIANDDYGPSYFSIERCEKCEANRRYMVWFSTSLENRAITPATFRAAVDSVVTNLTKTIDLWDEKNWQPRR